MILNLFNRMILSKMKKMFKNRTRKKIFYKKEKHMTDQAAVMKMHNK